MILSKYVCVYVSFNLYLYVGVKVPTHEKIENTGTEEKAKICTSNLNEIQIKQQVKLVTLNVFLHLSSNIFL